MKTFNFLKSVLPFVALLCVLTSCDKEDTDGNVSTYAGTAIPGFADGKTNVAQFGFSNTITCSMN